MQIARPRTPMGQLWSSIQSWLFPMLEDEIGELGRACDWGCKKNSQSKKECWRGYKLHLDVIDGDIPVSAILTSASLHDSQAAIPLAQMSAGRIVNLYDLADAAYDADDARLTFTGRRPGPRQPPTTGRRRWSLPQNRPAPVSKPEPGRLSRSESAAAAKKHANPPGRCAYRPV